MSKPGFALQNRVSFDRALAKVPARAPLVQSPQRPACVRGEGTAEQEGRGRPRREYQWKVAWPRWKEARKDDDDDERAAAVATRIIVQSGGLARGHKKVSHSSHQDNKQRSQARELDAELQTHTLHFKGKKAGAGASHDDSCLQEKEKATRRAWTLGGKACKKHARAHMYDLCTMHTQAEHQEKHATQSFYGKNTCTRSRRSKN